MEIYKVKLIEIKAHEKRKYRSTDMTKIGIKRGSSYQKTPKRSHKN
jgi:hypothetical protein